MLIKEIYEGNSSNNPFLLISWPVFIVDALVGTIRREIQKDYPQLQECKRGYFNSKLKFKPNQVLPNPSETVRKLNYCVNWTKEALCLCWKSQFKLCTSGVYVRVFERIATIMMPSHATASLIF